MFVFIYFLPQIDYLCLYFQNNGNQYNYNNKIHFERTG